MSGFNGSGTYVRGFNWVNDAAATINITASRVDADMLDVVNGFNLCVTRDGQGKISADFDFNNLSGKNLASGSSGTPSLRFNSDATHGIFLVTAGTIGWSGNMQFSNTGSVVSADLSNATIASRLAFQDKTAGNTTAVMAIPNGAGASAAWWAVNNSAPNAAAYAALGCDASAAYFDSNVTGAGTQIKLSLRIAGSEKAFCGTAGNWTINAPSSGASLTVKGLDVNPNVLFSGVTKGLRFGFGSSSTSIDGVDSTGSGSYQPLVLTASTLNFGIAGSAAVGILIGASGSVTVQAPTSGNALTVTGNAFTTTSAVVAAATTTINCQTSNVFRVSMGANITTLTVSNPQDGQTINMRFKQDGSGSRTIAWPASFKWAGGSAPALSTAASAEDFVAAQYDATDATWAASMLKSLA